MRANLRRSGGPSCYGDIKDGIHKTRWFSRWARKEGLSDQALYQAVREMLSGPFEAKLGGNLIKTRIARPGQGKGGDFRTLVASNLGTKWFFVYGFGKNQRANIDAEEEAALKKLADTLLQMTPWSVSKALQAAEFIEVECDA